MNTIISIFDRLVTWFIPVDVELNQHESAAQRMLVYACLITSLFSLFYVAISVWVEFSHGIWLMLLNFSFLWAVLFLFHSTGLFRLSTNLYLANNTFVAILGCSIFSGGLYSPVTPWFTLTPVAALLLFGYCRDALLWFLISCVAPILYGIAVISGYSFKISYNPEYISVFSIICISGLVLILYLLAMTFDYNRNRTMKELQVRHEQLDQAHLQLKQQNDILENLASMDPLTNVPNRRAFELASAREWRRCQRNNQAISFIMIDIDQFKLYNDNYGHGAGDECLARVAKAINDCINRPGDTFARYGGEEFAAIMSDTHIEGALQMAQQFHSAIAALAIPHKYSTVSEYATISIGVATTSRANELILEELSEAADKMLYQAKNSGRNTTRSIEI